MVLQWHFGVSAFDVFVLCIGEEGRRLCCLIRVLNDTQKLMTFLIFSVGVE